MINVTKTYLPDINKYKKYVDMIYETNRLTNGGQFLRKLEKRLEDYLGVKHIILVSNGTLALQIAYKALNLKDEVITTPFSFVATASSIVWEGLEPIFVDIDPNTYCMDYRKIEEKITDKTTALVPVHVFGNGCEVLKIKEIADKHNLKVIYDAAHAFDVKYGERSILNYGDISTISFHSTKVFHTIEGGAIVINDDEIYERIKRMIDFGISDVDKIECLGINCKMNEFQAAMGLCVLDDIHKIFEARKKVFDYYIENLSDDLQLQEFNKNCTQNYTYFPVVFSSEEILLKIKAELNNNCIYPRRYFYPSLEKLPYLKNVQSVPITNSISKRILCLPIYDTLKEKEINLIIKIINEKLI